MPDFQNIIQSASDDFIESYDGYKKFGKAKYEYTRERSEEFRSKSIEELIDDPYFLGKKNVIYPKNKEIILNFFEERKNRQIDLFIYQSGLGSGKTTVAGIILWLVTFDLITLPNPQSHFGLDPDSTIAVITFNRNSDLAKKVTFKKLAPFFDCPFFRDYFPPHIDWDKISGNPSRFPGELKFPKNIVVFPGTGSSLGALGYDLYAGVVDEANHMDVVADSKRMHYKEVYDAAAEMERDLKSRIESRFKKPRGGIYGFLAFISNPRYKGDFTDRKRKEYEILGEKSKIFFVNPPVWEAHPPGRYSDETFYFDSTNLVVVEESTLGHKEFSSTDICGTCHKPLPNEFFIAEKKIGGQIERIPCHDIDCYKATMESETEKIGGVEIIRPPIDFLDVADNDPDIFMRDKVGKPPSTIKPFFGRRDAVTSVVNLNLKNPFDDVGLKFLDSFQCLDPSVRYYLHVDIALKRDGLGLSMAHCTGHILDNEIYWHKVVIDFLGRIKANPGEEINLPDISELIFAELIERRHFNIALITTDQYQSTQMRQSIWNAYRIPTGILSVDRTTNKILIDYDKPYGIRKESTEGEYGIAARTIRSMMYFKKQLITMPFHPQWKAECLGIEEDSKTGEVKKPVRAYAIEDEDDLITPSDDLFQSVAGSVFNVVNNEIYFDTNEKEVDEKEIKANLEHGEDGFYDSVDLKRPNRSEFLSPSNRSENFDKVGEDLYPEDEDSDDYYDSVYYSRNGY